MNCGKVENQKTTLKKENDEFTNQCIMDILGNNKGSGKKPVSYEMDMDFIDDIGAEEEVTTKSPRRGNPEHVAQEHIQSKINFTRADYLRELESGRQSFVQKNILCTEDEQMSFMPLTATMKPNERILGPDSPGMFTSLTSDPVATDLIQRNQLSTEAYKHSALAPHEPSERNDLQKRKAKKKKEKGLNKEYKVTESALSNRSVNEILAELGENIEVNKPGTGKNKRKKSKENQKQQPTSEKNQKSESNKKKDKKNNNNSTKMEKEEENVVGIAAPINTKRASSGVAGSWEDAEEEFLSADEDMGGSNSRLTTPPAEFVDARTATEPSTQTTTIISDVMLDPKNYRVDDEVDKLAQQLKEEEEEFITVGKKKKIPTSASFSGPPSHHHSHERERNSPQFGANRRIATGEEQSARRFSATGSGESRRPTASQTTLGDYMETTKKETHKNAKNFMKKTSPQFNQQRASTEKQISEDATAYVDALETTVISTPITVVTSTNVKFSKQEIDEKRGISQAPPPAFSYADVAKKSSGESTPQNEMSPTPPQTQRNAIPIATTSRKDDSFVTGSPPTGVQLPPSVLENQASSQDVSFGYEETPEEKELHDKKRKEAAAVANQSKNSETMERTESGNVMLNLNGKMFCIGNVGRNEEAKGRKMDPNSAAFLSSLQESWKKFVSGKPPVVYKAGSSK